MQTRHHTRHRDRYYRNMLDRPIIVGIPSASLDVTINGIITYHDCISATFPDLKEENYMQRQ